MTLDDRGVVAVSPKVDFVGVILLLKVYKKSIVLVWFVTVATGLLLSFLIEPRYEASVTMVAADKRSVSPGVSQLGGLASLAGLSIGASSIQEPIALLRSKRLARLFIEQNDLLPILFAEQWDPSEEIWRVGLRNKPQPTIESGVDLFVRNVRVVTEERRTGIVTLTVNWRDPVVAARWANQYVSLMNLTMKNAAISDLRKSVIFLKTELANAEFVSLQQSIGRVLETELQKLTVASGTDEYALKVVDGASVAIVPDSPNRALIGLFACIFGLLVGSAQAFFRNWLGSTRSSFPLAE